MGIQGTGSSGRKFRREGRARVTARPGNRGSPEALQPCPQRHLGDRSFGDKEQRRNEGGPLGHPLTHDLAQVSSPSLPASAGLCGPRLSGLVGPRSPSVLRQRD